MSVQPLPSRAQAIDAETLAAAAELTQIFAGDTVRQTVQQITEGFWPTLETQLRSLHIDDASISDIRPEVERITLKYVTSAMQSAPALYAKHYTADEIRQLIAFYRTPVGLKAISEMPAVGRDLGALIAPQLPAVQAEAAAAITAVLRQHGYGK